MTKCVALEPVVAVLNRQFILLARQDPTRTSGLRRRFLAEMMRRWGALRLAVLEFVGEQDGLKLLGLVLHADYTAPAYPFPHSPNKEELFRAWLDEQFASGILAPEGGKPGAPLWTAPYVRSAYRSGLYDAAQAARAGGYGDVGGEAFARAAFDQPETMEKLHSLYTRSYELLKDVTDEAGWQMSEVLTLGIAEGRNPMDIARQMADRIGSLSRTRAATIARTEIIHAHAEGQLDAFKALGVETLGVQAEWSTAGDERVCDLCAELEGKEFTVEEARGLIPRHPNCRCTWIPTKPPEKPVEKEAVAEEGKVAEGEEGPVDWERVGAPEEVLVEQYKEISRSFLPRDKATRQALFDYIGSDGYTINSYLRTGVRYVSEEVQSAVEKKVSLISEAFRKARATQVDIAVYRGFSSAGLPPLKVGDVLTDKAFVSTSFSKREAIRHSIGGKPVVMRIVVPKGTQVLMPSTLRATMTGEREVLLPRNSRFLVKKLTTATVEGKRVQMAEVELIPESVPARPTPEKPLRYESLGKDDMARRAAYLKMSARYAPAEGTPEWDALESYVGTEFININGFLREGGEALPASKVAGIQKKIALLDKMFDTLPALERDVVAFRGTLLPEEWSGSLKPGKVLVDKGFVSTSLDKGLSSQAFVGKGPNYALFEIRVPKGQKAIFATAIAKKAELAREVELLLRRDSRFLIREVEPGAGPRGATLVKVDLVPMS